MPRSSCALRTGCARRGRGRREAGHPGAPARGDRQARRSRYHQIDRNEPSARSSAPSRLRRDPFSVWTGGGSNSTATSTSLSARDSPRAVEPKRYAATTSVRICRSSAMRARSRRSRPQYSVARTGASGWEVGRPTRFRGASARIPRRRNRSRFSLGHDGRRDDNSRESTRRSSLRADAGRRRPRLPDPTPWKGVN